MEKRTHTHTGTLNESSAEQRNEKRNGKKWKTRRTEKYAENRGIIEMCTFLNKHVEKPKSQCFWSSAHCIISFYLLAWKLLLPFLWLLLCFIWLRARCFHSGVFFGCVFGWQRGMEEWRGDGICGHIENETKTKLLISRLFYCIYCCCCCCCRFQRCSAPISLWDGFVARCYFEIRRWD